MKPTVPDERYFASFQTPTFTINAAAIRWVDEVAEARQAADAGRKTLKVDGSRSDADVNWDGVFAEVAVALYEGKPLECAVHRGAGFRNATGGNDVGDWEIKATRFWLADRIAVPAHLTHKHKPQAKYLLVAIRPPEVRIAGWLYGHEFLKPSCLQPKGSRGLPWCDAYVGSPLRIYARGRE